MALSLHERRMLHEIERDLAHDPELRALATFTEPTPEPEREGGAGSEAYLIDGNVPRPGSTRKHRLMVALAMVVLFIGPAMLVPALLTGITLLALPMLAGPLTVVVLLTIARHRRRYG